MKAPEGVHDSRLLQFGATGLLRLIYLSLVRDEQMEEGIPTTDFASRNVCAQREHSGV